MRLTENGQAPLLEETRVDLIKRLRARQLEIGTAIFTRLRTMSQAEGIEDAEYEAGLREAITAVVDYSLAGIEQGGESSGPIPSAAITQARRAARNGVSLDAVVLRYIAGHRSLGESIMDEVDRSGLASYGPAVRHLYRSQEALLEHLMTTIVKEYKQECELVERSPELRHKELVQSLLAGEPIDTAKLDYEFDQAWHLGAIAIGSGAEQVVRGIADGLGCQLLRVLCDEGKVWAWFGGRRRLAVADVERLLTPDGTAGVSLTIGESRRGIDGWRLTHQEAQAALVVTLRRPQMLTRCADVPLEAAVLWHETLARSLVGTYLLPLASMKDGGEVSRNTLRAYFKAGFNTATAAVVLKVDRHTVERRLRMIEKALGRFIPMCHAELEVALRLEELGGAAGIDNIQSAE